MMDRIKNNHLNRIGWIRKCVNGCRLDGVILNISTRTFVIDHTHQQLKLSKKSTLWFQTGYGVPTFWSWWLFAYFCCEANIFCIKLRINFKMQSKSYWYLSWKWALIYFAGNWSMGLLESSGAVVVVLSKTPRNRTILFFVFVEIMIELALHN